MSDFNLSALAVRERSVTLFLLVAISIAGVVAFLTLGRAEDPALLEHRVHQGGLAVVDVGDDRDVPKLHVLHGRAL